MKCRVPDADHVQHLPTWMSAFNHFIRVPPLVITTDAQNSDRETLEYYRLCRSPFGRTTARLGEICGKARLARKRRGGELKAMPRHRGDSDRQVASPTSGSLAAQVPGNSIRSVRSRQSCYAAHMPSLDPLAMERLDAKT